MADMKRAGASDKKRQTITIVLIIGIVIFLIWQITDMLGTGGGATEITSDRSQNAADNSSQTDGSPAQNGNGNTPQTKPQTQQIAQKLPMSEREAELLRLQQQTQTKYIEAVNQLQMLKLSLQIAETNKNIMAAKLATIKDQKDIVELLEPPKKSIVADYTRSLQAPVQPTQPTSGNASTGQEEASPRPIEQMAVQAPQPSVMTQQEEPSVAYTVVSVSKINDRWSAVIGVQGALFSIHVGDIIPADGSKVISINSRGIVLERNGKERKVSLVPII